MFRKIHSRSHGLAAALTAGLGHRIAPLLSRFSSICHSHPKKIFSLMIFLMSISLVLCFSIMRLEKPELHKRQMASPIVAGASSEIGLTIDKLQRVMALQSALQSMAAKDSLSSTDSLRFSAILVEIKELTTKK